MHPSKLISQKGFTIIDIVMVIVIIGILAAVAIPRYVDATAAAQAAREVADVAAINTSLILEELKAAADKG